MVRSTRSGPHASSRQSVSTLGKSYSVLDQARCCKPKENALAWPITGAQTVDMKPGHEVNGEEVDIYLRFCAMISI